MNNANNSNNESEIDWSTIPTLSEIVYYLNKSDIITLSQACKYIRLKLSSKIFYQLTLFNQVYLNYRKVNNVKLRGSKLKLLICTQMIADLASKAKLIKKVVINSRLSSKFTNLFFEKFKYCKVVIIDCKYDFKLSAVYNILKNSSYLEAFFMEAIYEREPKNTLPPPNFKFPNTLKSLIIFPYILERNFIPAINEINFNTTHPNIVDWNITGSYDTERFIQQQPNIIHLYLRDIPIIEPDMFSSILLNNSQLKSIIYELELWSIEKLNNILLLPNLQKLYIINYSFDKFNLINFNLITNKTIKTLVIECSTPSIVIEELLNRLEVLENIIFISWNLEELSTINWLNYRGRFNSITFGTTYWQVSDFKYLLICLEKDTIVTFDNNLKKIVNYNLSI